MRTKQFNDEVLYADEDIVKINQQDIDLLKEKALLNARQRMRICAHRGVDDSLHEMIIVHHKDAYIRPHKHQNKIESFHIIAGEADVVLFDDKGQKVDVISMGDYSSGKIFYYRLSDPYYHTLLIKSDVLVFHEITNGPFNKADTIFPSWAPEEDDRNQADEFMKKIILQQEITQ